MKIALSRLPLCVAAIAAALTVQVSAAAAATFSPTGPGTQQGTLTITYGASTTTCNATFNGTISSAGFFGPGIYPPAYYVQTLCSSGYYWGFQMNEMAQGTTGSFSVRNQGGFVAALPSPFGGSYAQATWTVPFYNRTPPGPGGGVRAPRIVFSNTHVGGGLYVTGTLLMTTSTGADVSMS